MRGQTRCGDALVRDMKLWHRGTTNEGARPRPMLALIYHAALQPADAPVQFSEGCRAVLEGATVPVHCAYVPEDEAEALARERWEATDRSHHYLEQPDYGARPVEGRAASL